jgi:asparagine synthetase B (glutamine-hydrolysing)
MCGIIVSIALSGEPTSHDEFIPWIGARGPDSLKTHTVHVSSLDSQNRLTLSFTSSVLHLRGKKVTVQPLISEDDDVLCWNGEIWKGLKVLDDENDGAKLLEALSSTDKIWDVMGRIEGPWAIVYYSAKQEKIYYGRDCLGRRSLLRGENSDRGVCVLSSVAVGDYSWGDDKVDGLWCIDLKEWLREGRQVIDKISIIIPSAQQSFTHGCHKQTRPGMSKGVCFVPTQL